ncbi:MAG: TIGR01212 family radical SAM protein [Elusimicrobiota bacterium]
MKRNKCMGQKTGIRRKYYRFSEYLKGRFGTKVFKISVDAGFSCPNRDGRTGDGGCTYCDNRGFSLNSRKPSVPLAVQINDGMKFLKQRYGAEKYIIYFQAYTNTYGLPGVLKEKYDTIRDFDNIVGISIGTRPDCIDNGILDVIEGYTGDYEVWIEYGVQSVHDRSLKYINRNHTYSDFLKALELTRKRPGIKVCAHVIIGIPGESREDILHTAGRLGGLGLDGIKIHPLHVIKGTVLEDDFISGVYTPLEFDEYLELAAEFLEYLDPDTVIQRITADCSLEYLTAPLWINEKNRFLSELGSLMDDRGMYQGRCCDKERHEISRSL